MKIVIIGLLSALLIQIAPVQASPVNNSVDSHNKQVVQAKANEHKTDHSQEPSPQLPKATGTGAVQKKVPQTLTKKQQLMRAAGIPEKDWNATDYIISKESSWRSTAWGKPTQLGRAYGLCQALPASKMASAGDDYMTNPVTQLKWCHKYAMNRYGGWHIASSWWAANRWW